MAEGGSASAAALPAVVRRYRDLPGPKGLPLLGSALQIDPTRLHEIFVAWAREYGPYCRARIGKRHLLIVSDHAVVGSVLRDRPDRFRRPTTHANVVREMGFEQGLFFANDDAWKRQRRMVMAAFDPGHVKAYFPTLVKVVQRLAGRWREAAETGTEIDLQADLMRFTVDAIAGLAFGADVNTLASDEDIIQHHLNRIFPAISRRVLAAFPYWRYLRLPSDRALDRSVHEVKRAIEGFIAQARAGMASEPGRPPRNLLEAMIVAADQAGSGVDDRDIAGNVFVMLVAGEDTTANTLAWMIDLLQRNPETMRRAREEVRRVAPDTASFSMEQMQELTYVEACIHETMRLKPVAPLLPSQANRDTIVGDVAVPANTFVIGLMRHDSLDARYFPEPHKFDPDRWLAGRSGSADARSTTRVSMPFGAGPRLCPGRYLAMLEMKMAIAMLLGHFEIERAGTRDGKPARELFAFAMGPVGLKMKLARSVSSPTTPAAG